MLEYASYRTLVVPASETAPSTADVTAPAPDLPLPSVPDFPPLEISALLATGASAVDLSALEGPPPAETFHLTLIAQTTPTSGPLAKIAEVGRTTGRAVKAGLETAGNAFGVVGGKIGAGFKGLFRF